MVADAVLLGEPQQPGVLDRLVVTARQADGAPEWLRNIKENAALKALADLAADYGDLLHPTHGPDVAARLLADAPRNVPTPAGVVLLGCFQYGDNTSLAGVVIRRDGPDLTVVDALEHGPLDPYPASDAAVTDIERHAAEDLAAAAATGGLRPSDPLLRVSAVLDGGPDPAGLLTAAGLVADVDVTSLQPPAPDDTKSLDAFKAAALRSNPSLLVAWDSGRGTLAWFYRWARTTSVEVAVVHGAASTDAAAALFDLLLPRARLVRSEAAEQTGFRTVQVALDKVGSRNAALGDDLRLAARACPHKVSGRKRAMHAEAKVKGAKNVQGLPEGSTLRGLKICGDMGCTLCWATYRVPIGSGWPPRGVA